MGRAIDAPRGDEHPRHRDRLALQVAGLDRGEVLERDLHAAALQREHRSGGGERQLGLLERGAGVADARVAGEHERGAVDPHDPGHRGGVPVPERLPGAGGHGRALPGAQVRGAHDQRRRRRPDRCRLEVRAGHRRAGTRRGGTRRGGPRRGKAPAQGGHGRAGDLQEAPAVNPGAVDHAGIFLRIPGSRSATPNSGRGDAAAFASGRRRP